MPDERSPQGQTGEDVDVVTLGLEACSIGCPVPCSSLDNWTNNSMARVENEVETRRKKEVLMTDTYETE